ncbi:hypothetical protein QOZ80_5AG0383790 [Eleusine coracana subsp. coracana]|nr:hypothetical protein QOZ80_5AG0383790 [Eleusine coracana subsp. coracana]
MTVLVPHLFIYIDAAELNSLLPFPSLISHLRTGLAHPKLTAGNQCPQRISFLLPNVSSVMLLMMSSWCAHPTLPYLMLKAITSFPSNSMRLSSIHAVVSLFNTTMRA